MDNEKLYWLAFSAFKGIGSKKFALLRNYFGSAEKAWQAEEKKLRAIGLGPKLTKDLLKFRHNFSPNSYFLRVCEKGIECYFLDDDHYPESLKKTDNPPFVLYVKGTIKPEDQWSIAIVGTRKMISYGKQVTERLTIGLIKTKMTVVSGLARGIDTAAHRSALKANGRIIGVLACGLDIVYPPENFSLVKEIINGHGAVVSEFPLGMRPFPGSFPARNRIISGLSLGTVVIECPKRSGALITARHAAEQGREVFAVPGPVTSPNTAGPSHLIKIGAKLVYDTNDVLDELKFEGRAKDSSAVLLENPEQELILFLIKDKAKRIDELVRESGFDLGKVASIMSLLEIKGKVENLGNMVYGVKK